MAAQADSKAATVVVATATVVAAVATVVAAAATAAEAPQETEVDMDVTIAVDPGDHDPGSINVLIVGYMFVGHHHDEAADRHQNTTITEDRSSIASSYFCLACLNCTFLLPYFFPLPITDIFVLFISS